MVGKSKRESSDPASSYAGDAFQEVKAKVGVLRTDLGNLEKVYGKKGDAFDHAANMLDSSEKAEEVDYAVSTAVAKKVGAGNAKTLRKLADVLNAKSELEGKVKEAKEGDNITEFAEKRIAELSTPPYAELEAARTDETREGAYAKLIASTYFPLGDENAKPTYATQWVNDQLNMRNEAEGLSGEITALTEVVRGYLKPPKQEGNDPAQQGESLKTPPEPVNNGGKKEEKVMVEERREGEEEVDRREESGNPQGNIPPGGYVLEGLAQLRGDFGELAEAVRALIEGSNAHDYRNPFVVNNIYMGGNQGRRSSSRPRQKKSNGNSQRRTTINDVVQRLDVFSQELNEYKTLIEQRLDEVTQVVQNQTAQPQPYDNSEMENKIKDFDEKLSKINESLTYLRGRFDGRDGQAAQQSPDYDEFKRKLSDLEEKVSGDLSYIRGRLDEQARAPFVQQPLQQPQADSSDFKNWARDKILDLNENQEELRGRFDAKRGKQQAPAQDIQRYNLESAEGEQPPQPPIQDGQPPVQPPQQPPVDQQGDEEPAQQPPRGDGQQHTRQGQQGGQGDGQQPYRQQPPAQPPRRQQQGGRNGGQGAGQQAGQQQGGNAGQNQPQPQQTPQPAAQSDNVVDAYYSAKKRYQMEVWTRFQRDLPKFVVDAINQHLINANGLVDYELLDNAQIRRAFGNSIAQALGARSVEYFSSNVGQDIFKRALMTFGYIGIAGTNVSGFVDKTQSGFTLEKFLKVSSSAFEETVDKVLQGVVIEPISDPAASAAVKKHVGIDRVYQPDISLQQRVYLLDAYQEQGVISPKVLQKLAA